jgi:hypothetical protein
MKLRELIGTTDSLVTVFEVNVSRGAAGDNVEYENVPLAARKLSEIDDKYLNRKVYKISPNIILKDRLGFAIDVHKFDD